MAAPWSFQTGQSEPLISSRCLPVDFFERCDRYPRRADTQPEEHFLRHPSRKADSGERSVGLR